MNMEPSSVMLISGTACFAEPNKSASTKITVTAHLRKGEITIIDASIYSSEGGLSVEKVVLTHKINKILSDPDAAVQHITAFQIHEIHSKEGNVYTILRQRETGVDVLKNTPDKSFRHISGKVIARFAQSKLKHIYIAN